ncbi:MAG: hypothetical protein EA376_03565 [Phycisphaeraceae bacterium]|nr:MAG: hypothetical protein EA376_03565 [Phycisphaeraceae bacterium]
MIVVLLLALSNLFMTAAWYGHLKFSGDGELRLSPMKILPVILIAWMIALPEYFFQVPANRIGHVNFQGPFTAPQLKVLQEAITLVVFTIFCIVYLKEKIRLNDVAAFALIFLAVIVSMAGRDAPLKPEP